MVIFWTSLVEALVGLSKPDFPHENVPKIARFDFDQILTENWPKAFSETHFT